MDWPTQQQHSSNSLQTIRDIHVCASMDIYIAVSAVLQWNREEQHNVVNFIAIEQHRTIALAFLFFFNSNSVCFSSSFSFSPFLLTGQQTSY